jgi:hypothetical protein
MAGNDIWGGIDAAPGDVAATGGSGVDPSSPKEEYLELIGTHLRASGVVDLGRFRRVTDYVNMLDGFFSLRDVVLLTRTGEATRITMPELRVRLDDVSIVGQLAATEPPRSTELGVHVDKVARRLVVMTRAHIVYGYAFVLEGGSIMQFVDSTDPRFIPMSRVRVRWIADRRLAARYPFALVQRSEILGVATEGTGAPREARARRRAAVAAAEAQLELAGERELVDPPGGSARERSLAPTGTLAGLTGW